MRNKRIAPIDAAALAAQANAEQTARLTEARAEAVRAVKAGRAIFARRRTTETIATALRAELEELKLQSASDLRMLEKLSAQIAQARHERDLVANSIFWKLTWPVRRLAATVPNSVRRHCRRAVMLGWQATTFWGLPQRWRANGERDRPLVMSLVGKVTGDLTAVRSDPYENWIKEYETPANSPVPYLATPPLSEASSDAEEVHFSFLLADVDHPAAVEATLGSLLAQRSHEWELLAPADMSEAIDAGSGRFVAVPEAAGLGRSARLNVLLSKARGHWIAVLDAGDILATEALEHVWHASSREPDTAVFYSDEDEITEDGRRQAPLFKPEWSPEMLHAFNYFGRLTLLSRASAIDAGGFPVDGGAGTEWSLHLRVAEGVVATGRKIGRIPSVLCHRVSGGDRDRPAPGTAAAEQHRAALRDFWAHLGIHATVETQPDGTQRSSWDNSDPPLVSIIMLHRESLETLQRCLDSVLVRTRYANVEVIIVENRADDPETLEFGERLNGLPNVRVIHVGRSLGHAAACNRGAAVAKGSLLLFLSASLQARDPSWLGELARVASLPGVGVVGTKLRYPDGAMQHAGVSVGIHLSGVMFHCSNETEWGVFGSPNYTRNWSAIAGACQMVRRVVFDLVGGFDEGFQIANSDVALCLRAQRMGWRTAYTPFAELVHHDAKTHGRVDPIGDMARLAREVQRLGFAEDPYLHPQISGVDVVLRLRAPGEDSLREALKRDLARIIASVPVREGPLDLFDNRDVEGACGLRGTAIFWPPQPADQIADSWAAARWILDLLRGRTDLRRRFPRALSDGAAGPFAAWLTGDGGRSLGLSEEVRSHIGAAFATEPAARARQYYFQREDLRGAFPLALLPAGRRNFAAWAVEHRDEGKLRREEVWWLLLQCAEDPAGELVRTYLFTPAWQEAHPAGLTRLGRDRFSAWLSSRYDLPENAEWLNPNAWPVRLSAAEQLRLAYAVRDDWRSAHPYAFRTTQEARAFIAWLTTHVAELSREIREWCAARLSDGTVAELAAPGANIIGHFCYVSGLRVSAEAMAEGIERAGGTVTRRDIRTGPGDEPHHAEFGGLESHDITIIHVQPEPFFDHSFSRSDLAERTPRTYRIAYWYWELEAVPAIWGEMALGVDEIWAATNFVADGLRKISPVQVRTLPPGVRIGAFTPRSRQEFGLRGRDDGRFAFLFTFNMASVMERKNPLGLIRAFRQAFTPAEPVDLVLKTTSFGALTEHVEELHAAAAGANISILDEVLTRDETLSLMDACDAYVSLHRSEGLGLTMAEAMLLGKPVIATRYSGNLDFMDDGNSLLVDYDLVQVGSLVPPYEVAAHWAEPSTEHAAQLMRRVYEDQSLARELGIAAQRDARKRLAPAAAGKRILERLAEIKARRYC